MSCASSNLALRALSAAHTIEQGLLVCGQTLSKVIAFQKKSREFGHSLLLRYHRLDDRFEWRRRDAITGEWRILGARVPWNVHEKLRSGPRSAVEEIEVWQDARQDAKGLFRLWGALCEHPVAIRLPQIRVVWTGPDTRHVQTWNFALRGHYRKTASGALQEIGGRPVSAYPSVVRDTIRCVATEPYDRRTKALESALVRPLLETEQAIALQARILVEQRSRIRLYYCQRDANWGFRELVGAQRSKPLPCDYLAANLTGVGRDAVRGTVATALELIENRAVLRRLLRMVAEVAEVGNIWPAGAWQVRGYHQGAARANWVLNLPMRGAPLWRSY